MAKPDASFDIPEGEDEESGIRWGTWEELLLAFAVNRHGTGRWDSIASELQKRSSDPTLLLLTPQNCKQRYLDLKRRFITTQNDNVNNKTMNDDNVDGDDTKDSIPLLEELRKLRVAELRREVQRYDLNIESLELKMKRMEEEREESLRSEKNSEGNSDLGKQSGQKRKDGQVETEDKPWSGSMAGEPVTGNESEKDHLSVNESNSTDLDAEKLRTGEKELEPERTGLVEKKSDRTEDAEPVNLKADTDRTGEEKPVREESCNGSSDSIEKDPVQELKVERPSDSAGLVDSEAESMGGGDTAKESSDVQSSASRSKKEDESDKIHRGSMSGDERDHDDQSGTIKDLFAASQPLLDLLHNIRAHKSGSIFDRQLQSQESSRYRNLIRQHVDLDFMESRLKEGWYAGSSSKFFRDLLLLVNNALVFFKKNSSEFLAATELRQLISKEMSQKYAKSDSSSGKQVSLQSLSMPKKDEPEPSHSLLLKPRIAGSMIVCRKRSSIAAKASASSSGTDKRKEQTPLLAEDKDVKHQPCQSSANSDEPKITKKRTRDRFASVAADQKRNNNNKNQGSSNNLNKNSVLESGKNQGKGGASSNHPEAKSDKKKNQPTSDSKKRSAASFLNRMKQGSSLNNGGLLDALKNTPLTSDSNNNKGSEQKKKDNTKRGEKKEQVTRRHSESKQRKEKGSAAKRSVGRPPKREAAPPPSVGKRGRADTEASKQPKKRSRKL